jgi:Tfp pilus assembly protein PilF
MNRASRRRQEKLSKRSGEGNRGAAVMAGRNLDALAEPIGRAMRLQQAGRLGEAAAIYRQALGIDPDHPAANHFYGLLQHQAGRPEEAMRLISRSLELEPQNADFHNNLGAVLKDAGQLAESARAYRRAIQLRPDYAAAHNNLGVVLKLLGRYGEAVESYRKALALQAGYAAARLNLANAEKDAGRLSEAAEDYREALKLRPNDPEAHYQLAMTLTEGGEIDPAIETFRRTIELQPRHAEAYLMLASLKRPREADGEMEAMERLYARSEATEQEKMLLAFALAKSFEDIGRYDEAFDYLLAGNAARRKTFEYSTAEAKAHFEEMKAIFDAPLFEQAGDVGFGDRTPVFILGMPRSGTTLVEQILASHPDVFGPGELPALQAVANETFALPGSPFPAAVRNADAKAFGSAGRAYVDRLRGFSKDAARITDKMPGNFMLIGLIRLILPEATVIHCVRDAPATCLSIFKTYFRTQGHLYGYDLEELADYYKLYTDLMAHWHSVLPGFVHDVRYEALVADQEQQSRKLVELCGLPWDDRCLAFHKAERPVRTASAAQVRQPMYDSSLELWRRYEKGLQPLLERLG